MSDILPCIPTDPTVPCEPDEGLGCRGNKILGNCAQLLDCDKSLPPVTFVGNPVIDPGTMTVTVEWEALADTDKIEFMVLMTRTKTGPTHDINYISRFDDGNAPDIRSVVVGDTMTPSYEYRVFARRIRNDVASRWSVALVGDPLHLRAFSDGFAVGFQ